MRFLTLFLFLLFTTPLTARAQTGPGVDISQPWIEPPAIQRAADQWQHRSVTARYACAFGSIQTWTTGKTYVKIDSLSAGRVGWKSCESAANVVGIIQFVDELDRNRAWSTYPPILNAHPMWVIWVDVFAVVRGSGEDPTWIPRGFWVIKMRRGSEPPSQVPDLPQS